MAKQACTSFNCPQDSNPDIPVRVSAYKMLQDTSGNYWCQACMNRCKLMDWAKEHEWPGVRVQSRTHYGFYVILNEEEEWFTSLAFGDEGMIDALYAGLVDVDE